jgi:tousled-like kinase
MEAAPFDDVKAVLGNLGSSNEARIALLEKRLAVPPSPGNSTDTSGHRRVKLNAQPNGNSMHSIGSGAFPQNSVGPSSMTTPQGSLMEPGLSRDGVAETAVEQAAKKRRLAGSTAAGATAASKQRESSSTPTAPIRPSLSPYLNGQEGHPPHTTGKNHTASTPGSKGKQKNTINRYLVHTGDNSNPPFTAGKEQQQATTAAAAAAAARAPSASKKLQLGGANGGGSTNALEKECRYLRESNRQQQSELQRSQEACAALESSVQRLEKEAAEARQQRSARDGSIREAILRLATENARQERELILRRLQDEAPRLGSLSVRRRGIDVQEVWEDGNAFKELQAKLNALGDTRESIEAARKACKRRLPLPGQPLPADRNAGGGDGTPMHPDDWVVQEEVYKTRLAALKREEDTYRADLARLEIEKSAHVRELKRLRDEDGSRFNDFPVLHNRYLLLNMLGRGGFSEVFRAYDLVSLRPVAVKIHQLSSQWSEAKKASYVKHSVREYHIHRTLNHPRIVHLLDIFEIDNNTFATVLDLCTGGDLEAYTKDHEVLPEREARAITAQVMSGLSYLNTKPRSIIHYDLKPANILFDSNGECKITDFGLSKVVEEGHTQGMELTSQGAGTYWYLPPECFDVKTTPMISNKVDVWSVGVILYQMLYGKRPFGHGQSQEQILRNEVMLNAREVAFPAKPSVSADCKDFIRKCLAYHQDERLDVHAAAAHPFMNFKKEKRGSGVGAAAASASVFNRDS